MSLADDIFKKAKIKLQTAKIKKKKGVVLRLLEKALLKSKGWDNSAWNLAHRLRKKRHMVWALFNSRKKLFGKDVYAIAKDEKFDFVLCHDSKAIPVAARIAKEQKAMFGFDLVEMTFARLWGNKPTFLYKRRLLRNELIAANAHFIISGDPYLSKDFKTRHPHTNPILILNGQEKNIPKIQVPIRERLHVNSGIPIVLYIGVVAPQRGIEQIIEAYRYVKTESILAVIGPGNEVYKSNLKKYVAEYQLEKRVKFLNGVEEKDVVPLARSATIGISPISMDVGNGGLIYNNKLFQYLAARLPILSTDCPGPGGFVTENQIGYLYEDTNALSLAATIDKALSSDPKNQIIRENLEKVAPEYTWFNQKKILLEYLRAAEVEYEK